MYANTRAGDVQIVTPDGVYIAIGTHAGGVHIPTAGGVHIATGY